MRILAAVATAEDGRAGPAGRWVYAHTHTHKNANTQKVICLIT